MELRKFTGKLRNEEKIVTCKIQDHFETLQAIKAGLPFSSSFLSFPLHVAFSTSLSHGYFLWPHPLCQGFSPIPCLSSCFSFWHFLLIVFLLDPHLLSFSPRFSPFCFPFSFSSPSPPPPPPFLTPFVSYPPPFCLVFSPPTLVSFSSPLVLLPCVLFFLQFNPFVFSPFRPFSSLLF